MAEGLARKQAVPASEHPPPGVVTGWLQGLTSDPPTSPRLCANDLPLEGGGRCGRWWWSCLWVLTLCFGGRGGTRAEGSAARQPRPAELW